MSIRENNIAIAKTWRALKGTRAVATIRGAMQEVDHACTIVSATAYVPYVIVVVRFDDPMVGALHGTGIDSQDLVKI